MRITVALTPSFLTEPSRHVVAVVDVLRATTTIVTMLERGLSRAIVSENIQRARRLGRENFALLCGEVHSLQPPGFDYGNSPAEFASLSLEGKTAVVMTTNGTRALSVSSASPFVAAAALLNRRATARRLVAEGAERGLDVAVVCAGLERGTAFSLEDTAAAGAVVEAAIEADPALHMTDESWAALHLWHWYDADARRLFHESAHGRSLHALGLDADLAFASQVDIYDSVPVLSVDDAGVKSMAVSPAPVSARVAYGDRA